MVCQKHNESILVEIMKYIQSDQEENFMVMVRKENVAVSGNFNLKLLVTENKKAIQYLQTVMVNFI